jgi:hypothetical protein
MGRKSSIDRLEPEIKAYIQAMLASGSMTLDELIADLRERWPAQSGSGELPSRSALHRYGSKLDRRLTAIRASTEAAKLIQAHAGDDKLFEAILALQEADEIGEDGEKADPGERVALLSKAAKNIATLTRSSINLKEFQAKVEEATRRKLLAEQEANLQEVAKAQGMDDDQVNFWKEKFLGIPKPKGQ